jgi:bidirectional [NiFe] hydrogenase diaphorase subunit
MVEINRNNRKRLVASCAYPVQEGLVVETDTDMVKKVRKLLLELLWPSASDVAKKYGVTSSRFSSGHSDCSMCGLCVRYCDQVKNKKVLFFKGRGVDREVAMIPELAVECVYCQECFKLCNGGWIVHKSGMPWSYAAASGT